MNDELIELMQSALEAYRAAWETIAAVARECLHALARWWHELPRAVQKLIAPPPATIMRRKIQRYARMRC